MSPWTVRNTFIAWGADFKRGVTVRTPASNVDLAPTLLALMNLDREVDLGRFDGRPLTEAFADGPDEEQVPIQVRTISSKRMTTAIAPPCRLPSRPAALRRQELAHSLTATPQFLLDKICVASLRNR